VTAKPAADNTPKPSAARPGQETPSGFSSSLTLHDEGSGATPVAENPARVKEDAKVARFYWNLGNYEGAYLRYKDAVVYAPQDAEMWFQLAESERQLGRYVQSKKDYEHCAELSPTGNRAKEATRWANKLPDKDKPQPDRPGPKVP
jgi:tetratricopeptide (TPR) repeat protein